MGIEVRVIADSISVESKRITTMQVKFHRFILPEFNTHRVFSRNFSSSRAIPTKKLLEQVLADPAMPVHWGKNEPGMQANSELDSIEKLAAQETWKEAANSATHIAKVLSEIGTHKQIVNRVLEPYLWVHGIVTSTEWDNFFGLRCHPDAQPEIQALANAMKNALDNSAPTPVYGFSWHLPYVTEEEKDQYTSSVLKMVSAARCCRVSYLKHDGTKASIEDDKLLFDRLTKANPIHASPFEHQARPISRFTASRNFKGWYQYREELESNLDSQGREFK